MASGRHGARGCVHAKCRGIFGVTLETIVLCMFWRCTSVIQRVQPFQQISMTFAIILMRTAPNRHHHHHDFKITQLLLRLTVRQLQVVFIQEAQGYFCWRLELLLSVFHFSISKSPFRAFFRIAPTFCKVPPISGLAGARIGNLRQNSATTGM